jgi:hypothetical protein
MTFEEYWGEVERLNLLPRMAIQRLPKFSLPGYEKEVDKKKARGDGWYNAGCN